MRCMDSPILLYHEVYGFTNFAISWGIWIPQFLCALIARLAYRRSSIYHSPRVFHNEKPEFAPNKIYKNYTIPNNFFVADNSTTPQLKKVHNFTLFP